MTETITTGASAQREALEGLEIGRRLCACPGGYHVLWGLLRSAGVGQGLKTEQPVLEPLLAGLLAKGGHVLVAGAADSGSLALLHACARGEPVRFTVADLCAAPLERVTRYAGVHGINAATIQSDLAELKADDPWDLVFIHYTLSFADQALRRRVLCGLARGLTPAGTVVCAVKFAADGDPSREGAAADSWQARIRPKLAALLEAHPGDLAVVDALLPEYARMRASRKALQPVPAELEADFAACGLVVRERIDTPRADWAASGDNPTADRQHSVILVAGLAANRDAGEAAADAAVANRGGAAR